MKILRSGKDKKPPETTITCRCTCKFSFTRDEANFVSDPRGDNAYTIKCPECNYVNWIDVSLVK